MGSLCFLSSGCERHAYPLACGAAELHVSVDDVLIKEHWIELIERQWGPLTNANPFAALRLFTNYSTWQSSPRSNSRRNKSRQGIHKDGRYILHCSGTSLSDIFFLQPLLGGHKSSCHLHLLSAKYLLPSVSFIIR